MTNLDLAIISIACGSPFGVHYFFRSKQNNFLSLVYSIGITVFWIPYALLLLHINAASRLRKKSFDEKGILVLNKSSKINSLKRNFEKFLPGSRSDLSLFEFRELVERYSGLSMAVKNAMSALTYPETELFTLAGHSNPELASIVLNRRNLSKLNTHLTVARLEFLKCLAQMFESVDNPEKLCRHSYEFVTLLNDAEAASEIATIFERVSYTQKKPPVKVPEHDLWNLEKQPHLNSKSNSRKLKVTAATTTSPSDA